MAIPRGKEDKAKRLINRQMRNLGIDLNFVEIDEKRNMLWFHQSTENGNIIEDAVEPMARALVEGLEIDDPFLFEYAYTCSRHVCGQFGGGAFVIMRGFETFWVVPSLIAENWIKDRERDQKDPAIMTVLAMRLKIAECVAEAALLRKKLKIRKDIAVVENLLRLTSNALKNVRTNKVK
jgi:hypothetical protein